MEGVAQALEEEVMEEEDHIIMMEDQMVTEIHLIHVVPDQARKEGKRKFGIQVPV